MAKDYLTAAVRQGYDWPVIIAVLAQARAGGQKGEPKPKKRKKVKR